MAKQSGIHQIKGKIGEHSYYRQTGVNGGLIRSINQGLSARVKTDEAFANTRLNNQEFGAAANVAGLLGQCVTPKFRPMILPFSQSKMAKEILKVARENTASWGQRVVTSADTAKLCAILSAMSKRAYDEFAAISFTGDASDGQITVSVSYTAEQATLMASLGIDSFSVLATQYDVATGLWVPAGQIMTTGYVYRKNSVQISLIDITSGESDSDSKEMLVADFVPAPNHYAHQLLVFVVMPTRTINGVSHILQEYCSFVCLQLPAGE